MTYGPAYTPCSYCGLLDRPESLREVGIFDPPQLIHKDTVRCKQWREQLQTKNHPRGK